jgi:hypothetical protein
MARLLPEKRRALVIVLAGVAIVAAIFFGAKVVMPHSAPNNPIAAVTSAPGKARAVAAASNAAGAKVDAAGGTSPTPNGPTTTSTAPAVGAKGAQSTPSAPSGPQPNTTRNPFLP